MKKSADAKPNPTGSLVDVTPPGRVIEPLHLDHIAGGLTKIVFQFARPVRNTLAEAVAYEGRDLAELFPEPGTQPAVQVTRRWQVPGIISEDLVFRSAHEPISPGFRARYQAAYPELHTVYARRIRPTAARQRPRLLYLHGYMQPETVIEEAGLLTSMALALNVEVVQMQVPHHGRRASRRARFSGELFCTADMVRSIEALRQTMLDARTLLRWLQAQDDRPVGVAGLSLGGALTLLLTCLEPRFAFSIPMIAHMDLAALVRDAPVLSAMRHDLRRYGWRRDDFAGFVERIGWHQLEPQLARDQILLLAASSDRFFDPQIVEEMWRRWSEPEIHWYPTSHMGFLPNIPDAVRHIRRFVNERADRFGG